MKRASIVSTAIVAAVLPLLMLTSAPQIPDFADVRANWRPSDAQLLDRNGEPLHELRIDRHGRRLAWAAFDEISPALRDAVVASEDHRFWSHRGVDYAALGGAATRAILSGRGRGASTITMQVASMLNPSLRRTSARRTLAQKLRQMRAAETLERSWSKRQVLETYLNLVTYRGELQGIGAASRVMFGKSPHGIDTSEAVVLASMIRAPNARRSAVEARAPALSESYGTGAPSHDAIAAAVARAFANRPNEFARMTLAPHLARRMLGGGAGSARCTLDRAVQQVASAALRQHLSEVRDRRVDNGAVIVAENSTGDVWAYVGGAGDISSAPYFDAARAIRQPGSTLKPFLYAFAVDRRVLTAASLLEDTPLEVSEPRGIYRPLDYDRQFRGLVTMRTALASSLNVPAVRTVDMMGPDAFIDHLRQLGFRGLEQEGDYYGAALALGSADVTLLDLVNAYRTLANGGEYSSLHFASGDSLRRRGQRVYSPAAAFVISDVLADRTSRSATFGLENSLATRYWSAVKTGTSKDMRDNWCVGYTDRFTVGVWVGNSSGAPMRDVSGVTGAAPVWYDVTNYLHDRFGGGEISRPAGVVASGVSFPGSIEPPRTEWFVAGTAPSSPMKQLGAGPARILSPTRGTIVALDPDIPPAGQRIAFEAAGAAPGSQWMLDGRALARADETFLWAPIAGAHRLTLADSAGRVLDTVDFSIRGSGVLTRHGDRDAQDDQVSLLRIQ